MLFLTGGGGLGNFYEHEFFSNLGSCNIFLFDLFHIFLLRGSLCTSFLTLLLVQELFLVIAQPSPKKTLSSP